MESKRLDGSGHDARTVPASSHGSGSARVSGRDLWRFFLQLGVTAFGGPVAHLAMMDRELIQKRRWIARDEFIDMVGLVNLIPGPNSTQLVMYVGYRHGRIAGMLIAGMAFIIPAAAITLALAWLYVTYGSVPSGQAFLFGVQPVVIAVIASALWRLLPQGIKDWRTGVLFAAALVAAAMGVSELAIIVAGAAAGWLWFSGWRPRGMAVVVLPQLFWLFLKMAVVLYGSGYVLVAYMQGALVEGQGWLTNAQLLDVLAIGQMTPGPILTTATAAGMLVGGWGGAIAATIGMFLPSFVLIGLIGPRIDRLRNAKGARAFLDGVNAAVVAVMLVVAARFAVGIAGNVVQLLVLVVSGVLLERRRVGAPLLVVLGGIVGLVWQALNA